MSKSKKAKQKTCDSSDSEKSTESTNEIHQMDIENIVKNNESVEGQTYQKGLLDNLGTISGSKGYGTMEVTSNSL